MQPTFLLGYNWLRKGRLGGDIQDAPQAIDLYCGVTPRAERFSQI